jgi:glycosyltransferase involved in cell wall biosynthesis
MNRYYYPCVTRVSFIVPIYNLQDYILECIESILRCVDKESEIILVDDGSIDSSRRICDELAKKDTRIRVIHQENLGVSIARNKGLDMATGEYICFVDGDDIVSKNFIKYLLKDMVSYNADMVACDLLRFVDRVKLSHNHHKNDVLLYEAGVDGLMDMLYEKTFSNGPCAKLYRRSIINDVRFTPGITVAEDLEFNYKVFSKAGRIVYDKQALYYYRSRSGSAMRSSFKPTRMHGLEVTKNLYTDAKTSNPRLLSSARSRLFAEATYILNAIEKDTARHEAEARKCIEIASDLSVPVFFDIQAKPMIRIFALVCIISPRLLAKIYKINITVKTLMRNFL